MRSILAISLIAVRNAIRSRVFLVLLLFMGAAVVGLPLTIKGDGTLEGQVRIVLGYSLSVIHIMLSIATLWAGCAAISTEIRERQIHLLATKPVHRWQIWAGKWLGLLWINAALLLIAGVGTYALTLLTLRPEGLDEAGRQKLQQELLVARAPVAAEPDNIGEELQARLLRIQQSGELPSNASADDVERALRRGLLLRTHSVPPGGQRSWTYAVEHPGQLPLLLRYKLSSSQIGPVAVPGEWTISSPGFKEPLTSTVTNVPGRVYTLGIPVTADRPVEIRVTYRNLSPDDTTVVFDPDDGITLLADRGGFGPNLLRALLIMFGQLALLAAIGVSAGTLFSLPVAVLCSVYLLVLLYAGPYLETVVVRDTSVPGADIGTAEEVLRVPLVVMYHATAPLRVEDPLSNLSQGLLVSWSQVGRVLLVQFVLYSCAIGAVASAVFQRKELALPTQ